MSARLLPSHNVGVAWRMAAVIAAVAGGFRLLEGPFRAMETAASIGVLDAVGLHGAFRAGPTVIGVVPAGQAAFTAVVTPSCSSLSSTLGLCAIGWIASRHRARRGRALLIAVAVVMAGNVLRIAGSVAVGLAAGRGSLILFHDSVGGAFAFSYILAGYMLLLWLLLPKPAQAGGAHER